MIHQPQKNLLLVVNLVPQVKNQAAALQVLLLVPPVVNQAPQAVLLVQALAHLLVNLVLLVQIHLLVVAHLAQVQARLLAQAAANQALRVPQAVHLVAVNLLVVPVHLVALQVPLVVNQVHLLVVHPLVVLPQVVRPVVLLQAVPLANLVRQVVVHQVRCQLTQLSQFMRDVHIKTTTLTTYMTPPLLHQLVSLKY